MMKKKGSKPANSEAVLTNNSNETPAGHVSPANQPSAYSHGKDNTNGTDTHPGSTSKKKKKKKNKTKTTLSAFENAQQHMGAAVAAAAVADFHQHGADWFSSSSSSQTSSLPPPPPPPPLPPTPRQLPPASQQPLHHHHHHSHHSHPHSRSFPLQQSPALSSSSSAMINSNSKQRHQQQRNGPKNNNSSSSVKSQDTDEFWSSMSNTEERQKIREFWLQLGEDERRSLVKVEKEAVLRKMKEQQKHSCNCSVCGKKRTAIEDELEVLYDAYYEELEQYANHQQHTQFYSRHPLHTYSATDVLQESYCEDYLDDVGDTMDDEYDQDLDDGDDEDYHDNDDPVVNGRMLPEDDEGDDDEEDDDDDLLDEEGEDTFGINYEVDHGSELSDDDFSDSYDDDLHNFTANGLVRHSHGGGDHFSFGNSLTVKGGILTVADDLLKNDGKKFLDMMERLAERRMQRDDEADMDQDEEYYDEDEDDDDIYDDENEEDTRTEEQRMEEGRRMFQIFAARMFEQRVLAAYREKVAKERQQRLIQELEEEDRQRQERELKKQRDKERKKDKKRQLKQKQEEERLAKEAQRQADEAKKRAEQQLKLEAERQKREQERRIKEEEKRLKDEERRLKEEEKRRRLKEEKERAAEKERQRKEKEDYDRRQREFMKEKHRHEKELKDELARRDRELKEQMQRHVLQTKERTTAKSSSDATKSTTTAALSPPTQSLDALSISKDAKASTHHSPSTPVSSSQPTSASSSSSSSSNPPSTSAPVRSTQPLTKQHFTDPTTTSTSNPIEQHNTDVFGSSAHHTNNIFAPPSQHLFGNVFPHLDILQSSHPLLGAPLNTPAPPPHPQPLPPAPVCILPQAAGSVPIGQPFHHPVDATQERSSFNAINQFQLSSSSSNTTSSSLVNPSGIAIPSQHGRRASAMAGPIGSPLTHRFNGVGSDHNGGSGGGAGGSASNQDATGALGNLSHRTGSDTAGPDHTFFSNFLFGEPRGISPNSSTTTTTETDLLGHHISKLDMPLDRRFSTETSAFGWKNGWSATSMLSENLHGKLFDLADRQADRHGMLLDRARLAYQKLDEITQTNFFLGGTTPYHTMAQLHRMMNDFYCDTTVDVNELYDVLVQSPQSGFQCIQHPRHGTVVRYEGTLSTASLPASSTTATAQLSPTATDDPLALRRSSTLLHNPLASSTPSSSSFPSRPLPNHHPTHPIPLASSSHHLLHPQQYHLPPNAHLSPPLLSPPPFTYTHSLHSSHNGQTNEKESG